MGRNITLEVTVWVPDVPTDEELKDTADAIEDDVMEALRAAEMSASVVARTVYDDGSDPVELETGEPRLTKTEPQSGTVKNRPKALDSVS